MSSPHSEMITAGIRVHAAAEFLPQDILPHEFREPGGDQPTSYVFRYQVTMTNVGTESARLLSRHWVIVDGDGDREEVWANKALKKQRNSAVDTMVFFMLSSCGE